MKDTIQRGKKPSFIAYSSIKVAIRPLSFADSNKNVKLHQWGGELKDTWSFQNRFCILSESPNWQHCSSKVTAL